jgi:hypothetical protein
VNDITVPRRVERILGSLGASDEFRQDVLGDLEEELRIRAAWDGSAAARRWYYRESLRVAPHLLRSWLGRLVWRDVFRFGGVVGSSVVAVVAFQNIGGAVVLRLAQLLGVPPRQIMSLGFQWSTLSIYLFWNAVLTIAIGYIAASMNRTARVPAALATGAFWLGFLAIAWFRYPTLFPAWFNVVNMAACFGGMLVGGLVRASRDEQTLFFRER